MKKNTFYTIIILSLLASNIVCIYLLRGPNSNIFRKHEGPRDIIIEKLDLSPKQVDQYDSLILWHRTSIKNHEAKLFKLKSELYSEIDSSERKNDSIINEINKIQFQIEKIHIKHFKDIEKLCDSSQKSKFKSLSLELSSLFKPRKP